MWLIYGRNQSVQIARTKMFDCSIQSCRCQSRRCWLHCDNGFAFTIFHRIKYYSIKRYRISTQCCIALANFRPQLTGNNYNFW